MSLKKNLVIVLISASAGVTATLAASYFTSGTLALPTKGGNSALPINEITCGPAPMPTGRQVRIPTGVLGVIVNVESEFDYLNNMITHQEEAIATAKLLKVGTNRDEMKKLADDIIQTQSDELEKMQSWLNKWYPNRKQAATSTSVMRDLNNLTGDDLDKTFLEDMKMHHQTSIDMSRQLLTKNLTQREELKTLAAEISNTQTNEISQMESWLQSWFGTTARGGDRDNVKK